MKKLFALLVILALIMTSCASDQGESGGTGTGGSESGDTGGVTDTAEDDNTLGDDNGDGIVEGGDESNMNSDNGNNSSYSPVDKVNNTDDAMNFIGGNVYSMCEGVIPSMTSTRILTSDELDSITYDAGITDAGIIEDVIVSESAVGDVTYSLIMFRTDGSDTETLHDEIRSSVNTYNWSDASFEKASSIVLDDDILLVVGSAEQVDSVMNAVRLAADGVYDEVGETRDISL